jgi:NNP family nitrate/nitrite transporter-like MFS transporter
MVSVRLSGVLTAPASGSEMFFPVEVGKLARPRDGLACTQRGTPEGTSGSLGDSLASCRSDCRAWALTLFYFLAFGGFVGMSSTCRSSSPPPTTSERLTPAPAPPASRCSRWSPDPRVERWRNRIGAAQVLRVSFVATAGLAILAAGYRSMVPLTAFCLTLAVALGLGTGAVFKLVAQWFPGQVGAVTGGVGAAGGLGGFFPPLVMGTVKSVTGSYVLGFVVLSSVAGICLACSLGR